MIRAGSARTWVREWYRSHWIEGREAMRFRNLSVLGLALALANLTFLSVIAVSLRQSSLAPAVTISYESHFSTPQPLPSGPLDQVFEVVDLDPGAATAIHFHLGPGFATVLQGEVTHHRFALDHEMQYAMGDTWVELPQDVHFARNDAGSGASILATFILPSRADISIPTTDQPDPAPPGPTVPDLARVAVASPAADFEITQLERTYDPGAQTSGTLASGQAVVLVTSGQLTVQSGKSLQKFGPGDFWVESSELPSMSWNDTTSTATAVVSMITP